MIYCITNFHKFESNNKLVALNILHIPYNIKKIRHAYKPKHNLNRENQLVFLMIDDGEKQHYLAVNKLPALLRGITSNNNADFYCLDFLHLFRAKNKLKNNKNICENHNYCQIEMPKQNNNVLKYNFREKSMKAPFVIYADLEFLLKKMSTRHNDPEK